jgi:hypothetical protein
VNPDTASCKYLLVDQVALYPYNVGRCIVIGLLGGTC